MDCTYRPNDVVPIVGRISGFNSVFVSSLSSPVGCALAGLVLMVLVAYLVGEHEHRASKIGEHEWWTWSLHFSFQVEERAARGVTRVFEESLLRGRFKSEIGTCHQVIFYWLCFWLESNWIQSYETRVRKWAVEWSIFTVFHDLKEFSCQKQDRRNSFKIDHKPNIIESSSKSILGRLIIFIALGTLSLCAW